MQLTKARRNVTYVVVEDAVDHQWGFFGFDADREILLMGSRSDCAQWILEHETEGSWIVMTLKQYEEGRDA